jgi:hypothetical protein
MAEYIYHGKIFTEYKRMIRFIGIEENSVKVFVLCFFFFCRNLADINLYEITILCCLKYIFE